MFESEKDPAVALLLARKAIGFSQADENLLHAHATLLLANPEGLTQKIASLVNKDAGDCEFTEATKIICGLFSTADHPQLFAKLMTQKMDVNLANECIQAGIQYFATGLSMGLFSGLFEFYLDYLEELFKKSDLDPIQINSLFRAIYKRCSVAKLLLIKGTWMANNKGLQEQLLKHARLHRLYATLSNVSMAILHAEDASTLHQTFCHAATQHGFHGALIAQPGQDGDLLEILAVSLKTNSKLSPKISIREDSPLGTGPIAKALRSGNTQVIQDARTDPTTAPWLEIMEQNGIRSIVAVPLKINNQTVSCIALYAEEPDYFRKKELELVSIIGREMSRALEWLSAQQNHNEILAKMDLHRQHDTLTGW